MVIEELLNSIFHQTYSNYEVVIVDGLSTDNTLEIAKKWLRSSDKIISEKDSGVYDAMNKALDLATGDFLILWAVMIISCQIVCLQKSQMLLIKLVEILILYIMVGVIWMLIIQFLIKYGQNGPG